MKIPRWALRKSRRELFAVYGSGICSCGWRVLAPDGVARNLFSTHVNMHPPNAAHHSSLVMVALPEEKLEALKLLKKLR